MSKGTRYIEEFKQEAVKQVVRHGYAVHEVSERLGVSDKTLYLWLKKFDKPKQQRQQERDLQAENARLKHELKRATKERDILKEASVFFAGIPRTLPVHKSSF